MPGFVKITGTIEAFEPHALRPFFEEANQLAPPLGVRRADHDLRDVVALTLQVGGEGGGGRAFDAARVDEDAGGGHGNTDMRKCVYAMTPSTTVEHRIAMPPIIWRASFILPPDVLRG